MNVRWSVGDDRGMLLNFLLKPANVVTEFSFVSFISFMTCNNLKFFDLCFRLFLFLIFRFGMIASFKTH